MSSASKPLVCLLGLLLWLGGSPPAVQAQSAPPTNTPAFKLTTTRHELEGLGYYFRAVATEGTNQLAFIVPKGYFIRADEANRQLRAIERDDKCSITVRLFTAPTNAVDQATGTVGAALTTSYFYNRRGNVVMTIAPNGPVTQSRYDG
ncbi:MAG: hypothetical protein EBS05_26225, partial [Proteobacteria bacterium]|nr:hypothetical protein [Pseudomonadota bacterium]